MRFRETPVVRTSNRLRAGCVSPASTGGSRARRRRARGAAAPRVSAGSPAGGAAAVARQRRRAVLRAGPERPDGPASAPQRDDPGEEHLGRHRRHGVRERGDLGRQGRAVASRSSGRTAPPRGRTHRGGSRAAAAAPETSATTAQPVSVGGRSTTGSRCFGAAARAARPCRRAGLRAAAADEPNSATSSATEPNVIQSSSRPTSARVNACRNADRAAVEPDDPGADGVPSDALAAASRSRPRRAPARARRRASAICRALRPRPSSMPRGQSRDEPEQRDARTATSTHRPSSSAAASRSTSPAGWTSSATASPTTSSSAVSSSVARRTGRRRGHAACGASAWDHSVGDRATSRGSTMDLDAYTEVHRDRWQELDRLARARHRVRRGRRPARRRLPGRPRPTSPASGAPHRAPCAGDRLSLTLFRARLRFTGTPRDPLTAVADVLRARSCPRRSTGSAG